MRVLMVVLEDFPGSENRVQRQALALRGAGHEVRVIAAGGSSVELSWHGMPVLRTRMRRRKGGGTARRFWEYLVFPLEATLLVSRVAASWNPDVIQVANMPDWLIFSTIGSAAAGRLLVLDIHDPMPELLSARGGGGFLRKVLEHLEAVSLRRAHLVLVPTPRCSEILALRHGVECTIVPNAVDTTRFAPADVPAPDEDSPRRIVYHGTMARRFGVELVVRAAATLRERGMALRVDLYGDGDLLPDLCRDVTAAGLDGTVHLHGQVSSDSLPALLAGAELGLVPYLESEFMNLAYSTKAFEYGALGIPMVAAAIPSLREQLGEEAALFFRPGDHVALADAIEEMIASPALKRRCAEAARARAATYDWRLWGPRYVAEVVSHLGSAEATELADSFAG